MAYLLDGAVILIFILFVWVGSRRGLVRSVLRLISCVVSLVLALLLSTVAAGGLFDAFLSESAQEIIAQHLPETDAASVASGVEEALHQLPGFVESALTAGGLGSPEEIASSVQDVLGQSPETVAQAITEQVIRPAAVALMGSVCFLLLFLLFMILFGILIGLINRVFQLPVLKQLNGALGAVVGAAEGLLVIFCGGYRAADCGSPCRERCPADGQRGERHRDCARYWAVNPLGGYSGASARRFL